MTPMISPDSMWSYSEPNPEVFEQLVDLYRQVFQDSLGAIQEAGTANRPAQVEDRIRLATEAASSAVRALLAEHGR